MMRRWWLKLRLWWVETEADACADARQALVADYRHSHAFLMKRLAEHQEKALALRQRLRSME